MAKYEDRMSIIFINTGILDEADTEFMQELAKKNHVDVLPSILLLDAEGKLVSVISEEYAEEDVEKEINRLFQ
jgi:FKBP-type peptidyl-prolyl cis-trans isomerase (trigger factor)